MSGIPFIYEIGSLLEKFRTNVNCIEDHAALNILSSAARQGSVSIECDRQVSCPKSFMSEVLVGEIRFLTPDGPQCAP
jgi:hypothetical protein